MTTALLISSGITILIIVVLMPMFIPLLHRIKFGQSIREDGPTWHKAKTGTPTMGGIVMIIAVMIATFLADRSPRMMLMLGISVGFGAVGFIDDYIKVVLKRNLGLTALQKFLLQLLLTVVYIVTLKYMGYLDSHIVVPFLEKTWDIGVLYVPLAAFVMLAIVNSVNLTDGIDGLAASVTTLVSIFFVVAGVLYQQTTCAVFAVCIAAACVGFFLFNKHPAKIFMGDTGSLFFFWVVGVVAISLKMPLILVIVGIVYLIETLSDIIQVVSFKTRGKRVFKMCPIHHHFEMSGWSEWKIVIVAVLITLVFCLIGILSILPNAGLI